MKRAIFSGIGIAMALAATRLIVTRDYENEGSLSFPFKDKEAPNDQGAVVDTTREGKRARRRRRAQEGRK